MKFKKSENKMAIVAIFKNEGKNLVEWIEYHLNLGFEKFYLYDNESSDNPQEILRPFIKNNKVVYTFFPGKGMQLRAYNDALKKYRYKIHYMAFIDLDEFIMPLKNIINFYEYINNILSHQKNQKV